MQIAGIILMVFSGLCMLVALGLAISLMFYRPKRRYESYRAKTYEQTKRSRDRAQKHLLRMANKKYKRKRHIPKHWRRR
ncbi:hypothetical protein D3C71_448790 [compost metagenome]